VVDSGIGIALEDQEKLFQSFTQVDGSLSRRHEGTGLGLALVRSLVSLHGGEVGVVSAPGEGSTFWLTLPQRSERKALLEPLEHKLEDTLGSLSAPSSLEPAPLEPALTHPTAPSTLSYGEDSA